VDFADVLKVWMWEEWKPIVGRGVVIVVAAVLAVVVWMTCGETMPLKKSGQSVVGHIGTASGSILTSIKSPRYDVPRRGPPITFKGRGVALMVFTDLNVFPNEASRSEDEDEDGFYAVDTGAERSASTGRITLDSSSSNIGSNASPDSTHNASASSNNSPNTSSNTSNCINNSANASPTHSLKRARSSDSNASDATTSSKRHHSAASAEEQSLDATAGILGERAWLAEHDVMAGRVEREQYVGSDGDDDSGEDDGDDELISVDQMR